MYYSKQYMNQAKRQLSIDMSWEDDTKKFRTFNEKQLINSFEDLSNELIYEIFDYLDIYELFNIFSSLNQRFQNLLFHSNLPLKCYSSTSFQQSFENICSGIIKTNKHRIFSLNLSNRTEFIQFFTLYTIDSSFNRLQSLTLHSIKFDEAILLLPTLTSLPQLFSLKISLNDAINDTYEIYRLIFCLPVLKYTKLSAHQVILLDSVSISDVEQFSSIEQLVIDHPCTLYLLYSILFHTQKLNRLICDCLFDTNSNSLLENSLRIFNLTFCSIRTCYLTFDKFEIFIKKLSSQLRVLHLTPYEDINYFDADRWERLISQFLPYLHTFQFQYSDAMLGGLKLKSYHTFIHRFTSSFWIEKRWSLDIENDFNYWPSIETIYSIQSHKKQWYDSLNSKDDNNKNTSMDISKLSSQLTIKNCHFEEYEECFIDYIQSISSLTKTTSLYIEFTYFSIEILIQFLQLLPNLDSLIVIFKKSNLIKPLTEKQIDQIHRISNMNKIVKINLEEMFDINHIEILLNLCPQMQYFQIQCTNFMDLKSIMRLILMKRKSNLSSLCFSISKADEIMVKNIQTMIYSEKLLVNYTIHRIHDRIYLQWEKH